MNQIMNDPCGEAVLVLADGTVFSGRSIGAQGAATGRLVFNTDEFGYQEILTDPHYAGKIVALTYPEIGNVGVNAQDIESVRGHAAGLVVRSASPVVSNFRAEGDLPTFLREKGIVAISGIDTRALVRRLRRSGPQMGTVVAGFGTRSPDVVDKAREAAEVFTESGLVDAVTCGRPYAADGGAWIIRGEEGMPAFRKAPEPRRHVVAIDLGITRDTLRDMAEAGLAVTVVPAKTPLDALLEEHPDGVFLSNGPGGAEDLPEVVSVVSGLLAKRTPVFGVGLGAQVLALAAGARVRELRCGHHGSNHPVRDLADGAIAMVKQDTCHVVEGTDLPAGMRVTHESLLDGSVQGFVLDRAMGYQGAPDSGIWSRFVELMGGAR